MGNSYFQFKQFIVKQEKCAMKVCTDACIFGAYISSEEKDKNNDKTNILDIGTGTGLLSLMIAQKVKGSIDAVEIDQNAFEQARENFRNSLWASRLSVFNADITQFEFSRKYDIIVSNPPFFKDSLRSNNEQKNTAKHISSLSYSALASIVYLHLADTGRFYILLPIKEFEVFEKIATENRLVLMEKTNIRPNAVSDYCRTTGVFTNAAVAKTTTESLTIKDTNNEYSPAIIELLKDYYLYLQNF